MTDGTPQVVLGLDAQNHSVVIVEGATEVSSVAGLVAAAPGLLHPDAAAVMARAVAHLAAGTDFRVIEDPAAYEAAYRAQVETEDPDAPWRAGVLRLRDHGMPDFKAITAPAYRGTTLVFFAAADALPLPYRVEIDVGDGGAVIGPDLFRAVALVPFPPSARQPARNPAFVGATGAPVGVTDEERAARIAKPERVIEAGDDDEPESE